MSAVDEYRLVIFLFFFATVHVFCILFSSHYKLDTFNYIRFFIAYYIHFSFQFYVQLCACQCLIKNYLLTYLLITK